MSVLFRDQSVPASTILRVPKLRIDNTASRCGADLRIYWICGRPKRGGPQALTFGEGLTTPQSYLLTYLLTYSIEQSPY